MPEPRGRPSERPLRQNRLLRQMIKTNLLIALTCTGLFLPVFAGASNADFMPTADRTCKLHLANGRPYVLQYRTFRWKKNEATVYTSVSGYYALGSGEFLWWGMDYSEDAYFRYGKKLSTPSKPGCTDIAPEALLLRDGEWAYYLAVNSSLRVFHSNLRFLSIEKAWQYVAEHPEETSSWNGGKWVELIDLAKVLGPDFFHRPERLRYDARPYTFMPLLSVNKVDSTWELKIQGTDERAIVVLDSHFKPLKVLKTAGNSAQ